MMKRQTYFLSAVAALAAFGVSLGLLITIDYFVSVFSPPAAAVIENVEPVPAPPKPEVIQAVEPQSAPVYKSEDAAGESASCSLDVEGDYYFTGDPPKGFEDFEILSIVTHDRETDPQNAHGVPIVPTGSIRAKREYKFAWVHIKGKKISFVTRKKNGVSYQFDGRFVEQPKATDEETDYPELKGRLIKWRGGVKAAVSRVELGIMCGC